MKAEGKLRMHRGTEWTVISLVCSLQLKSLHSFIFSKLHNKGLSTLDCLIIENVRLFFPKKIQACELYISY